MLDFAYRAQERADAFATLGLKASASAADVRHAWRRMAFETHPDQSTGSAERFAEAREAYELLKEHFHSHAATPQRPKMQAKPVVKARDFLVTDEETQACTEALTRAASAAARAHVAEIMRMEGRRVTYFVPTTLAEGINKVAVPTGRLVDGRKVLPRVVSIEAARAGHGAITIDEPHLSTLFPGARSVTIKFGPGADA